MSEIYCQSCAMPMTPEFYGTRKDGSECDRYCMYCFDEGKFTQDVSMKEMIEICVPHMVENGMPESEARSIMEEALPKLKRWQ